MTGVGASGPGRYAGESSGRQTRRPSGEPSAAPASELPTLIQRRTMTERQNFQVSGDRSNPRTLAPDDPRHGTRNGYTNYRCRCDKCRAAHAVYARSWARRNPEKRHKTRHDRCECGNEKHVEAIKCAECEKKRVEAALLPCGTRAAFARGCHCDDCRRANNEYHYKYWKRGHKA